ncbi:MAG: NUDIX hydrolase [Bacteroidales bacterium]|nr:NUDIX hydrolase [Bacteroidales bacterium]MDX9925908.1 NUDIX hydrolase [Bacteroidales bacterium]HNX82910.1 NUDIX hydrolase [Bacteroidales bacterium]HOC47466.1 NUDIX hydrolase [Bacteroidales bacterium]HPS98201.1 NUDIX hydrolase [Bacteroidales bacterium]
MENEILRIARRVQAIAQSGIHFAASEFDRERYEELRGLSVELAGTVCDTRPSKIHDLFTNETGFQTPKVDIRSVVLKEGKLLMVREKIDGRYSMPGGFADINYSPSEVAVKEVREETGLNVRFNRVLAIADTDRHGFPPLPYHFYKIVVLCDLVDGVLRDSIETSEAGFFDFDNLPELSVERNTPAFLEMIRKQLERAETYSD